MNEAAFSPEAVVEIDPGMELPREDLTPAIRWSNLKVGTNAIGTFAVAQNEILYRAVARAMVRVEQVVNIYDINIDGYEGYQMNLIDGSRRTILFYDVRAIAGHPYMLDMVDGKMVWATNHVINYVKGKPTVRDTGTRMYVPSTWADHKLHTCYTVLAQTPTDHGLTAPILSRSLFFKNAQRFADDQAKLGLSMDDAAWINPICHPNADYFTAALAHGSILGIRTRNRPAIVANIVAFMEDERRIVEGKPYQG